MAVIYREKNRFRRLWDSFQESLFGRWCAKHWRVWKTDRYIRDGDMLIPVYRIRFWPIHLFQAVALWLGYNLLLAVWLMTGAVFGRTVSFKPIDGFHAPLLWLLEMLR